MRYLYSFFICLYNFAIHLVSPFNSKAKLIIEGRKHTFSSLKEKINSTDKVVWFHLASLGEFEQGRPLIEKFRIQYPNHKILLTFFSPSGYEVRKNYPLADCIVYLPADSIANANRFIKITHPEMVFFIKYEFWFNFIIAAHRSNAKLFEISLILRPNQYFFSAWGKWFAKQLCLFDYFFVQNTQTKQLLSSIGINHSEICGDTRFDRVRDIALGVKQFDIVYTFCNNNPIVLMGSSWPKDEELMKSVLEKVQKPFKLIIAPHETHASHIAQLQDIFPTCVLYSRLKEDSSLDSSAFDILIIDCVGILSSLYQYATIAYIGGGFGVGIHNILEAATFGKPIIFGPNYQKFQEAKDLVKQSGAYSVRNQNELCSILNMLFNDNQIYSQASNSCSSYVKDNAGVVDKILLTINTLE